MGFLFMDNKLPDRVPLEQVIDKIKFEDLPKNSEGPAESQLGYMDDLEYHRTADALDVSYDERKEHDLAEKISWLIEWAKEKTGSDRRVDQLWAIKSLTKQLGWTYKGVDLIKKLYRFTRLDARRENIEKAMQVEI